MSKQPNDIGLQYPTNIRTWDDLQFWLKNIYDNLAKFNTPKSRTQTAQPTKVKPVDTHGIVRVYKDTQLSSEYWTILVDATDGAINIGLPAVGPAKNWKYVVKKIDASANAVVIDGRGFTIDGAATQSLLFQYGVFTLVSDGFEWFTV